MVSLRRSDVGVNLGCDGWGMLGGESEGRRWGNGSGMERGGCTVDGFQCHCHGCWSGGLLHGRLRKTCGLKGPGKLSLNT